jgi:hypothetical protein
MHTARHYTLTERVCFILAVNVVTWLCGVSGEANNTYMEADRNRSSIKMIATFQKEADPYPFTKHPTFLYLHKLEKCCALEVFLRYKVHENDAPREDLRLSIAKRLMHNPHLP